ncbi:unnamed protein product, partial [Rotaria sordida]
MSSTLPADVPKKWEIIRQSGDEGGQGEVSVIRDTTNANRLAAIKVYRKDTKVKRWRAHRELIALMKLEGIRNVSQLQIDSDISTNVPLMEEEAVESDQQFWTIMKYIPGVTLREFVMSRLKQDGTISLLAAIKLAQQLLLIVKQIHLRGIVHRDLKHLNLMVDEQKGCPAEDARIYVVDFGLAYIETEEEIDCTVNGLFLQLPLGQFSTVEVHQIDICADFTREIKTLLQLIKQQKEKYALEADTSPVEDTSRASAANAPRR